MAKEAELANYRWWDESEKVQWKKFNSINNTAVIPTDNKRYTKVDKYKALLAKENSIESIEYKKWLIDYNEDYESYDSYLNWDESEIFY